MSVIISWSVGRVQPAGCCTDCDVIYTDNSNIDTHMLEHHHHTYTAILQTYGTSTHHRQTIMMYCLYNILQSYILWSNQIPCWTKHLCGQLIFNFLTVSEHYGVECPLYFLIFIYRVSQKNALLALLALLAHVAGQAKRAFFLGHPVCINPIKSINEWLFSCL